MATTISKSFTAVGAGGALLARVGTQFSYAVSGTFVGTVRLVSSSNGGLSWEPTGVANATAAASGVFEVQYKGAQDLLFRYECIAFTSGTIVTSLVNVDTNYVESVVSSVTTVPGATTAWGNMASIVLPGGDWTVDLLVHLVLNGATMANATTNAAAISLFSTTTTTDHILGSNVSNFTVPTSTIHEKVDVSSYRVVVNGSQTVYAKLNASYSAGSPQYQCRLSARKLG